MSTTAVKKMSPKEACKIVIDSIDAAYTHQSEELKRAKQFMRTLADYATPVRPKWSKDGRTGYFLEESVFVWDERAMELYHPAEQ